MERALLRLEFSFCFGNSVYRYSVWILDGYKWFHGTNDMVRVGFAFIRGEGGCVFDFGSVKKSMNKQQATCTMAE